MTVLRVFIPFALGYFLSYLLRVVNAVIAPDLIADLGLSAQQLGLLTSANFLAFAAFQLPLGILLDRYGPRRTVAVLMLFATAGALVFATADGTSGLIFGRALIGLGAIAGTAPIEYALNFTDWRGIFMVFGGLALAFSAIIYLVVPKRSGTDSVPGTFADQIDGFWQIFKSRDFWRIAPLTVASQCAFLGTQSLWSGPWLKDVAGLPRDAVAETLFLIACAMVAGFLGLGVIADRLGRIGVKPINVALVGMTGFVIVQACLVAQWTEAAVPLWMLYGFFGTTGILPYAVLPTFFPASYTGRVITGMNVMVFFAAFAGQWGQGAIISLWPTAADGSYSADGYQAAFAVIMSIQVAGLVWYALFRPKSVVN